jgi:hypothetical protein
MKLQIRRMPLPVACLSAAEIDALQKIIPLAEDLAMRGDRRASIALEWMRDTLAAESAVRRAATDAGLPAPEDVRGLFNDKEDKQ